MLKGLELNHKEFVDLCILCGCDYSVTIDGKYVWLKTLCSQRIYIGIGPVTAYKLIKEHKSIEAVLEHLESENNKNSTKKKKYNIPKEFKFEDARELFHNAKIDDGIQIEVKFIHISDMNKLCIYEYNIYIIYCCLWE